MKEVADTAGVSTSSVSNAYHRPSKLSSQKREQILKTAQDLGYAGPHPGASSLRSGSVGSLGLLITDSLPYAFEDPATVLLLRGIAQVSQMANVSLSLLPSALPEGRGHHSLPEGPRRRSELWSAIQRSVVDGFLIYSLPDKHPAVDKALSRGLPCVVIDSPTCAGIPSVKIDDERAAGEAAEHLLRLGHRRIGILVDRLVPDGFHGPVPRSRIQSAVDGVAKARLTGYFAAFQRAGVDASTVPVIEAGGFLAADSRRAARMLLAQSGVTAVLASTDVLALAALEILQQSGRKVPDDVSVVGFDGLPQAIAAGLSTVQQPLVEKGRLAAQAIIKSVEGHPVSDVLLATTFHVGKTTMRALRT